MTYTAAQAARLSGCSVAQVETWREAGLVQPSDATPSAPAAASYSFRDLVALRMVAELLAAGLPMSRIRRAVAEIARHGDELAGLRLVTDGSSVWACRDDGQILDALRHGQLALFVAVDQLATAVDAEVRAFDADRRAFVADLVELAASSHPSAPRTGHPAMGGPPAPASS